jgi:hypothetical protein
MNPNLRYPFLKNACLFLILLTILSACNSGKPEIHSTSKPILTTVTPTSPTNTAKPSNMPSPIPATRTPTGTSTSTSTPSVISAVPFPIRITPFDYLLDTATPVAPPDQPLAQYSLKNWTEHDALNLIRWMDEYSTASYVYDSSSRFDNFGFWDAQWPVLLAGNEFLSQYKNSPDEIDVRWRMALSDAFMANPESDAWISNEIEKGFNDGTIRADNLDTVLTPYGFQIDSLVTNPLVHGFECGRGDTPLFIPELFDNAKVQILIIRAIGHATGLVVARKEDSQGQTQIIPIKSVSMAIGLDECQMVLAQDLTGDGIPEIAIAEIGIGPSILMGQVDFYQLRKGRFINILAGIPLAIESASNIEINNEPDGSTSLVVTDIPLWFEESRPEKIIYKWDGQNFYEASRTFPFPINENDIFNAAIETALKDGQYAEVANQLSDKTFTEGLENRTGPAQADYLTFELAFSQALMLKADKARETFQTLITAPAHPELSAIPGAARKFLEVYHTENDIIQGCIVAQFYYNSQSETNLSIGIGGRPLTLCDPGTVFSTFFKKISPTLPEDLPAALKPLGIRLVYSAKLDINGDGKSDWLGIPDYQSYTSNYLWFFISKGSGFQITNSYIGVYKNSASFHLQPILLPGDDLQSLLFQENDHLYILRLEANGNEFNVVSPLSSSYIQTYETVQEGASLSLIITHNPTNASHIYPFREIFHWDAGTKKFNHNDYVEQTLLSGSNSQSVTSEIFKTLYQLVPQIKDVNNRTEESTRYQYLLGLAYQWTGDTEKAAGIYYTLWHSQPDSPYAVMAREKLKKR